MPVPTPSLLPAAPARRTTASSRPGRAWRFANQGALWACAVAWALSACAAPPRGTSIAADPALGASEQIPPPAPRPAAPDPVAAAPHAAPRQLDASSPVGDQASGRHAAEHSAASGELAVASDLAQAIGERLVSNAKNFLGAPYRRGGRDPRGVDCSGLVQVVFAQESIRLPRTCEAQALVGEPVPVEEAQPGDLLFFAEGRATVSHVGIYAGGGEFIHASTGAGRVRIDELDDRYFSVRLREARRVVPPR